MPTEPQHKNGLVPPQSAFDKRLETIGRFMPLRAGLLILIEALSVSLFSTVAFGNYRPIEAFTYIMPNGNDVTTISNTNDAVSAFAANQLLSGYLRNMAVLTIFAVNGINSKYFIPIRKSLEEVRADLEHSDSNSAKTDAGSALKVMGSLKSGHDVTDLYGIAIDTGDNQAIGNLMLYFHKYQELLEQSVNDAQSVPTQIDAYVNSNTAGISLLASAEDFQGKQYGNQRINGQKLVCNQLIIEAVRQNSMTITDNTTQGWFKSGLGPEFRQIYGGSSGIPLQQLINDYNSSKVELPLGSIIVSDGHAAIFKGEVKVNGAWQLVTYDANDQSGYTVSLTGTAVKDDGTNSTTDPMVMLAFPGHQVGEHVTRLQWAVDHPIKVFQPVGDPPPSHPF